MERKGTAAMYAAVAVRLIAVEYPISYGPSEGLRPPQDDITIAHDISLADDIAIADDIALGQVNRSRGVITNQHG